MPNHRAPRERAIWRCGLNRSLPRADPLPTLRSRGAAPLPLGACPPERKARVAAKQALVLAASTLGADARSREKRERDDGNLPEIDVDQLAHAARRIDAALHGAKADREPVDCAGAQQREQFARARHVGNELSARTQAAEI